MGGVLLWTVDVSRDFMLGAKSARELEVQGRLYVPGAEGIIPNISMLRDDAERLGIRIIGQADDHTKDSPELKKNGGPWDEHCMAGSEGQRFIPEALLAPEKVGVISWMRAYSQEEIGELLSRQQAILTKDTYDVLQSPYINEALQTIKPGTDIFVFGVATDFCVADTVRGLCAWAAREKNSCRVFLVSDAVKAISGEGEKKCLSEFRSLGVSFVTTQELRAEIAGRCKDSLAIDVKLRNSASTAILPGEKSLKKNAGRR